MGLFSKSKKVSEDKGNVKIPWRVLSSLSQINEIVEQSKTTPVAIFKHSTRCGISRMVLRQFESNYTFKDEQLKLYYLDLLNYRSVSDEVGFAFQVMHQSPQLVIIKNGVAVGHASHNEIQVQGLEKFI